MQVESVVRLGSAALTLLMGASTVPLNPALHLPSPLTPLLLCPSLLYPSPPSPAATLKRKAAENSVAALDPALAALLTGEGLRPA